MPNQTNLVPAEELVKLNTRSFPNESVEYRKARNALLLREIELRRQIETVARQRRALPLGGEVTLDYIFESESGKQVSLRELFRDKDTLIIYKYMYGPERERPCPMCTSFMASLEKKIADIEDRISLAFVARSPIERQKSHKSNRGWQNIKVYTDASGDYTRSYVDPNDGDVPGFAVFTLREGRIYHFWSPEISNKMADPGQDPRDAPDFDPLWILLDTTPGGRGTDWYPKLEYPSKNLD